MTRRIGLALAALLATAAHAADLGTLFYSPAEREQLDRLRRGEPVQAQAPAADGRHAVTGFVERSDGRGVAWIDGRPVVVDGRDAKRVFDPRAVSAYSRSADEVKIEPRR
jgi:hypothetical protein